jgi:hypothetical protein
MMRILESLISLNRSLNHGLKGTESWYESQLEPHPADSRYSLTSTMASQFSDIVESDDVSQRKPVDLCQTQ